MSAAERAKSQRRLAELQAEFNVKAQALQEDQRRRYGEEQKKVIEKIKTAVDSIAKSEGYDMVLNIVRPYYLPMKNTIFQHK